MKLLKVYDPRDNLEKARRKELECFAARNNVEEIDPRMPATVMRAILRRKGLTDIQVPDRTIGKPADDDKDINGAEPQPEGSGVETDALSDLLRQWQAERDQPEPIPQSQPEPEQASSVLRDLDMEEKPQKPMPKMAALRKQAKHLGIKQSRKDTMASLQAKVEAHLNGAGNGNTAERDQ